MDIRGREEMKMPGPDLDSLHRAVGTLLATEPVSKDIARLKLELQSSPEPFVWSVVDCEALAGVLPKDIRSGWIFVLRKDTPSGAHHHPNSVQHMVMVEGAGRSVVAGEERTMLRFGSAGSAPRDLWYVIDRNVTHEFFPEGEDVVVISFHTCAPDELIEVEQGSGHVRRYES
jgi:mannose-6-phosphate isomerase-like protein (cupin superfamily)